MSGAFTLPTSKPTIMACCHNHLITPRHAGQACLRHPAAEQLHARLTTRQPVSKPTALPDDSRRTIEECRNPEADVRYRRCPPL